MENVNKQLLDALGKISRMTMSMYTSAGEAMSDAKRIAREAIAVAEQAQADDAEADWRRLALQFDGHRMQALAHLRCLLENPASHAEAVRAFLAAPPLSGEQVLANRIAEQAQQAEPVARDVIAKLVALTRAVNIALDDSEERDGMDGREHVIGSVNFDAVCDALEALEELPDNKPGWAMNAADKAEWALRHLTDAAQPPSVATDAITDAMEANAWRAALRGLCTGRELMTPDECAEHVRHRIESAKSCAQPPALAVPDGYALVPAEPTPEMVAAGAEGDSQFHDHARFVWRAMLAAAQKGGQ